MSLFLRIVLAPRRGRTPVIKVYSKSTVTSVFILSVNQDQLVDRSVKHLSGTGSSNKQTDFTNQAIIAGQNFGNFRKWPLVSGACFVTDQDDITNLTVRAGFVPFLAFLLQHAIFSLPATPKLFRQVLHSAPPFLRVKIWPREVSWRW